MVKTTMLLFCLSFKEQMQVQNGLNPDKERHDTRLPIRGGKFCQLARVKSSQKYIMTYGYFWTITKNRNR